MSKPLLVVLTGAGISAESGLATFRGAGGLWEGHDVMEVASIEGWQRNPALVLSFYNSRRESAAAAQPNAGHLALVALEQDFEVRIITQNVDDLHERAGSSQVLHLHGKLNELRSVQNPHLITPYTQDIHLGDLASDGSQLRPNIVWFGEAVPLIEQAQLWVQQAAAFAVIGTSLQVYPAAGLLYAASHTIPKFLIDPNAVSSASVPNLQWIAEPATSGVEKMAEVLRNIMDIA
ncbi:MAG: Sir2 family NAD-dependent protein deacetylase [Sphingobacteriaceae bacterium]|nr:Sir2 family NAD-dependent protein deacetylase [Sphingobacteriaceae bacterium]